MAVPVRRNGEEEEDDEGLFEEEGEGWADLDSDVPPHLPALDDSPAHRTRHRRTGRPDRILFRCRRSLRQSQPLHHTARGEHLGVVHLLLAAGASPKKRNVYETIPAELAEPGPVRSMLESAAAADSVACQ